MKRFRFQLEPVLNFKRQTLDALMIELGEAQARVAAREQARDAASRTLADYDAAYANKKAAGLSAVEALECESCQQVLARRVRDANEALERARQEAERKRREVVDARMEAHSLEKLREVRRAEYDAAAAKAEEKDLDDQVAAKRVAAAG